MATVKAPTAIAEEAATVAQPRQWISEEQPEMRLFLPKISRRPRWHELNLPDSYSDMFRKGDLFVEGERWAKFVGGKYVTSDPEEQAELERIEREGIAPIYEDSAVGVFKCGVHNFTTTNEKAWAAHQRAMHKGGSAPRQLFDVAHDDLGDEELTPYEG